MQSMTGFAERSGADAAYAWRWELRGVNGRGFDLRLRLPEGAEALDPPIRAAAAGAVSRGTLHLGLRVNRAGGAGALGVDPAGLAAAVAALRAAEEAAMAAGLALSPASADRLLTLPGVIAGQGSGEFLDPARRARLEADIPALIADFTASRAAEGRAIAGMLAGQLDRIAAGIDAARGAAEARAAPGGALLRERVAALLDAGAETDPARIAQELALLAVRHDVTEELDRLTAHVAAARLLLAAPGAVGRKLDFLAQEFNREANTLCAKAASTELTAIGLDLKLVIDQMREQVQNVE